MNTKKTDGSYPQWVQTAFTTGAVGAISLVVAALAQTFGASDLRVGVIIDGSGYLVPSLALAFIVLLAIKKVSWLLPALHSITVLWMTALAFEADKNPDPAVVTFLSTYAIPVVALSIAPLLFAYNTKQNIFPYGYLGSVLALVGGTTVLPVTLAIAGGCLVLCQILMDASKEELLAEGRNERERERQRAPTGLQKAEPDALSGIPDDFRAKRARYTFADVDGMDEFKTVLKKAALEVAEHKPNARNGILLYGPPGNGKSFMLEAMAGEVGLPIIHANFSQLASQWVNEGTAKMALMFQAAAKQGKVVLFFDEIDALLVDRGKVMQAESETARIVSAFLAEVDKLRRLPVLLVGATNHLDRLDPAAIRPGRFDFKLELTPPDLDARVGIFERTIKALHNLELSPETRARVRSYLDRMEGFSVSLIRALADEFGHNRHDHQVELNYHTLLAALRKIQGKSATEQERFQPLGALILAPATEERLKILVRMLKDPQAFEQAGGKLPRGVLLYGPPGTGKTSIAKAIAKESGWTFIQTTGHKLLHDPDEVHSVLERARGLKPAILFVDEADDILSDRAYSGNAALTNEFLTAMDGNSYGLTDVLFVAATNNPSALDSAAIRGGRLGYHVEVGLPGADECRRLVAGWFERKGFDAEAEGFDIDGFVRDKAGLSPADLIHHLDEWANERAARILSEKD